MTAEGRVDTIARRYREIVDEQDVHKAAIKHLDIERKELDRKLFALRDELGLDRFPTKHITLSVVDRSVTRYDPEHFTSIVEWAIEHGLVSILQRRFSDGKIAALAADGVELPEGMWIESVTRVNHRRG